MNHLEIYKTVKTGELKKLIGEEESSFFDAKETIYDLKNPKGKFELAKDVSSFANAKGGIIIIGLKTKSDSNSMREIVSNLCPINNNIFSIDSYRKILMELIYPKINNILDINFIKSEKNKGFLYIDIKRPPPQNKPYIITRTLEENNNGKTKLSVKSIAIATRQGLDTSYDTPDQIQKALKIGLQLDPKLENIYQEISNINNKISSLSLLFNPKKVEKEPTGAKEKVRESVLIDTNTNLEIIDIRLNELIKDIYPNQKVFTLSAIFHPFPNEIVGLFNPTANSAMNLVQNPPSIRRSGWNLLTLDRGKNVEGRYLQVTNGDRKVLRAYRDGCIIFAGSASEDFLGHGTRDRVQGIAINALAATEVISEFVSFCNKMIKHLTNNPREILFRSDLFNPTKENIKIMFTEVAGGFHFPLAQGETNSPHPSNHRIVKVENGSINIPRESYNLVADFFYFFGLTDEKFIYVSEKDNEKIIDIDAIKKII